MLSHGDFRLHQGARTWRPASAGRRSYADAIDQLAKAETQPTFVCTFAYPSGAAYGILLDGWSPGWTRRITSRDDLGTLMAEAARIEPETDAWSQRPATGARS